VDRPEELGKSLGVLNSTKRREALLAHMDMDMPAGIEDKQVCEVLAKLGACTAKWDKSFPEGRHLVMRDGCPHSCGNCIQSDVTQSKIRDHGNDDKHTDKRTSGGDTDL